ncbi:Flagellar motor switch protein FliM [uncultured Clostridium sp.]|uniref:FliM/FliN family flagellar motor switch protein n=1 Tax=uncultured Clostridium sp. TaxID=59620 RepID=UPI000821C4E2|nr:FliM/FliN family flagellar motor switch protein [uncultured Clostridium sp.]SCJ98214.1 Flagellar motor switch protein FliM [uncultured Clostridium sp.]
MEDIRLYDFKRSEKFSIENLKHLIQVSEEFCKTSNMQVSYETKNNTFKMTLDRSSQVSYGELIEKIDNNSLVVEYNVCPVVENLTLFIDKSVALSLVDLLLGGSGVIEDSRRELTNIDLELIKYLIQNLLKRIYIPYEYESISIVNIYTNPVQYQGLSNKDIVFNSFIKVNLENEAIGNMVICMPYKNFGHIVTSLMCKEIDEICCDRDIDIETNEVFNSVKNVKVDVCAILGSANISINDLINLEGGDVVLLNQKINDEIRLNVGDEFIYKAKPGLIGMKKGVEIIDIVNEER